ncbi:glucan endo-1,3-beta-glucosidase-like [Tasmannia lanceolata]|uniref:glucan endo-1,3-beta-glucosidase-like n=1 Tax=Tasmannia lanceolata TaxID=3420 RepID=UPI0040628BB7
MYAFSTTTAMLSGMLLNLIGLLLMLTLQIAAGNSIGVCYGDSADNLPSAQEVIDLYKSKQIGLTRLYWEKPEALQALRGSNIGVLIDVPNYSLQEFATNPSAANSWVQNYIVNYWPDVRFRYIAVGNEAIPGDLAQYVLGAMRNVYNAIVSSTLQDQIKVSTSISSGVLGNSYHIPSQGTFTDESRPYLEPIVQFITTNGAPLLINVYPYFSYIYNPNDILISYALFTSQANVVTDGQFQYQNLFDGMVDACYSALEKVGGSNVEIVVSESGWPSDGGTAATIENARTYNSNLIRHVAQSQGTPKRPGKVIETYVFAMFNENLKKPEGIENNFGLFYPNKEPVYPIDFP